MENAINVSLKINPPESTKGQEYPYPTAEHQVRIPIKGSVDNSTCNDPEQPEKMTSPLMQCLEDTRNQMNVILTDWKNAIGEAEKPKEAQAEREIQELARSRKGSSEDSDEEDQEDEEDL